MAELISYMRQYNESALEGEDLRFYGFDMQRISYSMRFLEEACKELEVDTTNLQKLVEGENWSSECDLSTRIETLTQVKEMSLFSRRCFMYSSTHTWSWPQSS